MSCLAHQCQTHCLHRVTPQSWALPPIVAPGCSRRLLVEQRQTCEENADSEIDATANVANRARN
jgi:hypothetical protein